MNKKTSIIAKISFFTIILGISFIFVGAYNDKLSLLFYSIGGAIIVLSVLVMLFSAYNDKNHMKNISTLKKDERYIEISKLSKSKAYDLFLLIFPLAMMFFTLWKRDSSTAIFLGCSTLFLLLSQFYFFYKYDKKI